MRGPRRHLLTIIDDYAPRARGAPSKPAYKPLLSLLRAHSSQLSSLSGAGDQLQLSEAAAVRLLLVGPLTAEF